MRNLQIGFEKNRELKIMENLRLNIEDISKLKSSNISESEKLEIIKCGKPHIVSLPYDRRTNDPAKLNERLEAIDNSVASLDRRIEEKNESIAHYEEEEKQLVEENEQMKKNLARMEELDQEMKELEQSLKEPFENEISEVINEINEINGDEGMPPIHYSGGIGQNAYNRMEYYYEDLNRIFEMSKNGGLLNEFDVTTLYHLARYLNYNDSVRGTDERFDNVCSKIRDIADKYNGAKNPQVIARNKEYKELGGSPNNLIRRMNNNDYWIGFWGDAKKEAIKQQESFIKQREDLIDERALTQEKFDQSLNR